jgi:WD40 repeat protein
MLATGSCAQLGKSGVLCDKGEIEIWDTTSHQLVDRMIGHNEMVNNVAYSPDGKFLASASLDGTVILWDTKTHQVLGRPFESDTPSISSLMFSPGGDQLAAGGNDGKIYIWDVNPESWKNKACALAKRNLSQKEWKTYIPEEPYHLTCPQYPAGQ